jgi:DnaJ-class molecular chaperone
MPLSLSVARDASDEDIKRAYRNLAQATHPDKHSSPMLREVRQGAHHPKP